MRRKNIKGIDKDIKQKNNSSNNSDNNDDIEWQVIKLEQDVTLLSMILPTSTSTSTSTTPSTTATIKSLLTRPLSQPSFATTPNPISRKRPREDADDIQEIAIHKREKVIQQLQEKKTRHGLSDDEKIELRRAKGARFAANSRARIKEYHEDLESQVNTLQADIKTLRLEAIQLETENICLYDEVMSLQKLASRIQSSTTTVTDSSIQHNQDHLMHPQQDRQPDNLNLGATSITSQQEDSSPSLLSSDQHLLFDFNDFDYDVIPNPTSNTMIPTQPSLVTDQALFGDYRQIAEEPQGTNQPQNQQQNISESRISTIPNKW